MIASLYGHVDVVRALIEAHVDVHSQNKVWYTNQSTDYVLTGYFCDFLYTEWLDGTSHGITRRPCQCDSCTD